MRNAATANARRSIRISPLASGATKDGAIELVPVGKAYFGFTDEELLQLDRWVRNHTVSRFGPVREVSANKDAGPGPGNRVRGPQSFEPAQIRRRDAVSADRAHSLG